MSVRHYDALNREVRSEQRDVRQAAGPPLTYTMHAAYDRAGNLVEEIDARGVTRRHAYDALNRRLRTTVSGPFGGPFNADGVVARLAYDREGNPVRTTDANGNPTVTEYDALHRPIRATDAESNVVEYAYDAANNRTNTLD